MVQCLRIISEPLVTYEITGVQEFLLFNYHGVKTSEPRFTRAVDTMLGGHCSDRGWLTQFITARK
jgi:hypothetical protein